MPCCACSGSSGPEAAGHYAALSQCRERTVEVGGVPVRLQCNPERIRSTASKVDRRSVAQRPCFLCDANRPAEQLSVPVAGRYQLLVNPYPIFPRHFTLPAVEHVPQLLRGRFGDMLQLAAALPACMVFYNGARCGASAPTTCIFPGRKQRLCTHRVAVGHPACDAG